MACCHKVVLLVDTAGDAARHGPARRAALRLLTYLSCRFGLARVHWTFKFFDSQGARSRPSRVSDFRELGSRSWEDFEEELEARLGDRAPGAHLPGPTPRAGHTHGALMETLLDYQWDRPEITSPTKPILRSSGRRLLDADSEAREAQAALGGFGNAVFLLAPCPHSQRELLQFVAGCEAQAQRVPPTPKQVMEKVLPKRVQEVMIARNVTLYWVDTTERSKLWASPDHVGYWTICELLHHGGGTILPSETWSLGFTKASEAVLQGDGALSHQPHLSPWISTLPTDATVNCLLYNSSEYEASFPRIEGTLFLPVKGKEIQETWAISLEPLAMHQRHFQKPIRIFLRGSVAQWSLPMSSTIGTDNWMLQSPEEHKSTQRLLFQELVGRLTAKEFHLVASVDLGEGWPSITGIISPFSANAMILTVFRAKEAEVERHFLQTTVAEGSQDIASLSSDVVDSVLNQVHNLLEDPASSDPCVPEWVQQELNRTSPWSPALVEKWFPFSNISGATSDLMESFWLLQAASPDNEDASKTESELTRCLSELYQRNSHEDSTIVNQERSRKKRVIPRTPVRQKMNTMSRSLKMLNVARLNVKAQKLHPDGSPDTAVEKGFQKTGVGRTADKEDRGRVLRSSKLKDFKTEEELLSYIRDNYQKTVATGEITLYSCAQNMVSTIKVFLKSKDIKELEVTCLNHMNTNLLKTSKTLRQNLGGKMDKEDKVRECQLQVFLRLEMCQQCPSILESADEVEHVVEEVTDLLRMLCLTKDSAYLSEFLEEILRLYIDSIPGTVGQLYHSLGLKVPQKLAAVLPVEFFSDDSMTQESKSPPLSSSAHRSVPAITESEQLEELRTRSAKKRRRKNALIRHKSIAEISQTLRQIEVPKVSKRATRNENSHPASVQPPLPRKDTVQEVTKVRRNLFNQEIISPSKRGLKRGLPRSHSVSTLECLHHKKDNLKKTKSSTFQGYHKLLTKSVAETPVHKQISRRLIHRQIKGRSSDPGPDIHIVEESPEKEDEINLRRSPRIKQLSFSRTNSGSFYSVSQPKSRSVQRIHSFQQKSDQRENFPVQSIRSPKTLLFGALSETPGSSKKGSAQIKRSSRSMLDSEISTAYQTPKKNTQKSPNFPKTTPRRFPRTAQTSLYTPERLQNSPTEITPAEGAISETFIRNPSSPGYSSALASKVTPQKRVSSLEEETSPILTKLPSTPRGPEAQPPQCLSDSAWLHSGNSSPESPCPASPSPLTAQSRSQCLSPIRYSFRTPPHTALASTPEHRKHQQLPLPSASQTQELAQRLLEKALRIPEKPAGASASPPLSPKEHFVSGCSISQCQLRKALSASPPPRERKWKEHQTSPSIATSVSYPVPSTPPRTPQRMTSRHIPPSPPSKLGRLYRKTSSPPQDFPECRPGPSAAPALDTATSSATIPGSRREQFQSSEGQSYKGTGFRIDWHVSSPVLIASDTEYLPLIDEAQLCSLESQEVKSGILPGEEGEEPQTTIADEPPSVSDPRTLLPAAASVSGSPELLSHTLHCMADRQQIQPAAQQEGPQVSEATGSPQTYELELDMQASGLPKLRIKKLNPEDPLEAEALGKESPLGEEAALPALSMPKASKTSSRTEHTYLSPPCLRPSHSTPGKSGGQTFICQSCTPSRCPPSTPSPFQADTGVPWTPSPKQSGKTTPEIIKDWPRRKKAVDCSAGPSGRGEASSDFSGALSLLEPEPEGKEQSLEHDLSTVLILEDFELEGVCQLPDQSPPKDSVSKAEEASWGQFGLGRKRLLSAKEEAEYKVKRVCDSLSEDPQPGKHKECSPHWSAPPLPSVGDDEVFVSGSTPPSSCMVRSCLSASGLQALTQSPLLFQGRTPSSHSKDTRDEDVDVFSSAAEESPFRQTFSRKRPFRSYTRKKLIS